VSGSLDGGPALAYAAGQQRVQQGLQQEHSTLFHGLGIVCVTSNPTAAKLDAALIVAGLAKLGGASYVATAQLQAASQTAAQQQQQTGRSRQPRVQQQQQLQLVVSSVFTSEDGLNAAQCDAAAAADAEGSCSRLLALVDSSSVSRAAAAKVRQRWRGGELLLMGYLPDCVSCYRLLPTDRYAVVR
jgi:hypothetical protein